MAQIIPFKLQPGDKATFEIGTTETVDAIVDAVKFNKDGDVLYDLLISTQPGGEPISKIEGVSSALVHPIEASTWQGHDQYCLQYMENLCLNELSTEDYQKWVDVSIALKKKIQHLRA